MILRLLIVAMMILAIAKYYLHDSKHENQTKPEAAIQDVQQQLQEIEEKQKEKQEQYLDQLNK